MSAELSSGRLAPQAAGQGGDHFRRVLEALPAAVYTTDAGGRVTFFNEAAVELWGVLPKLLESKFCGSWKLFWADGTPMPHDQCPMAVTLRERRPIRGVEAIAERPDGSRVPFISFPTPLFDDAGQLTGGLNMLVDTSARHEAERLMQLIETRYRGIFDTARVALWEQDFSDVAELLDEIRAEGVNDLRAYLKDRPRRLAEAVRRVRINDVNPFAVELFEADRKEALLASLSSVFLPETEPVFIEELVCLWEGRRRFESETALRTLDGRRLDVVFTVAFEGGRFERTLVSVLDISAQKNAERASREQAEQLLRSAQREIEQRRLAEQAAQRLAAIVQSSDDAILAKNLEGIITSWNQGAERLFGYTPDEAIGKPVTMLIPLERHNEEPSILARIRRGERIEHYETVRQRKDGSLVEISLSVSPVRNPDGEIVGASKIARDITERRQAQQHQQLLLREMDHRVKNLFSLAGSLVNLSARSAKTPEQLASTVGKRLEALARSHTLTLPKPTGNAGETMRSPMLHALIETIMSPYSDPGDEDGARVALRGLDIPLSEESVTSFALLLHEFATNAAKYGALSVPTGRVDIACFDEGDVFVMTWTERGGPRIDRQSDAEGFGSMLVRMTVSGQLGGELSRDWRPEGLVIRLSFARARASGEKVQTQGLQPALSGNSSAAAAARLPI